MDENNDRKTKVKEKPRNRVIDPIFDAGFKLIFGRERVSERLLESILNNIFAGDPIFGNITSLTFTNTERPNEYINGKGIRYDIKCETAAGHQYIVEMQKGEQKHFLERCGYYVSRGTAEQGFKGTNDQNRYWDFSLMPVVGVFFCNFEVEGLPPKPFTTGRLRDDDTGEPIGDFQRYAFVQIPCFDKDKEECKTLLEQWIYNIKNMGRNQDVAFTEQNEIFKYLESVSNYAALTPEERDDYEAALMRARDNNAILDTAKEKAKAAGWAEGVKEGRAKGRAEGREEGRAEGRAEGREEGREEGRAEGREEEKYVMARRMLAIPLPAETIMQITGLTLEELAYLN